MKAHKYTDPRRTCEKIILSSDCFLSRMSILAESDGTGSWILLEDDDDKENTAECKDLQPEPKPGGKENDEDEEEKEEQQAENAEQPLRLEELTLPETDSDGISVITDPEDLVDEYPAAEQIVTFEKREITKINETKEPVNRNGLTSACFMIIGLIIAIYFHEVYDKDVAPMDQQEFKTIKAKHVFAEPSMRLARDIEYIENNHRKSFKNKNDERQYAYKNDERQYGSKNEQKRKDKKLHAKDFQEMENFLNKKQQYLKNKEENLKRKDLKMNARRTEVYKKFNKKATDNVDGEWYGILHKGRDNARKAEKATEWLFERSQGRKTKRDKARWYFNMMDQRESKRFKKY